MTFKSREHCKRIEEIKEERRKMSLLKTRKFGVILGAIVIIFLVCNIPRLLLNLVDHLSHMLEDIDDDCNCYFNPDVVELSINLSHLFLIINSAGNFLIYFYVSKSFKDIFLTKLRLVHNSLSLGSGGITESEEVH